MKRWLLFVVTLALCAPRIAEGMATPVSTAVTVLTAPTPSPAPKSIDEVFAYAGMLDITELDDSIVLDLRYATTNNFTGVQHYEFPLALMHKDAAAAFLKAHNLAKADGYLLRIYDSYRPLSVQRSLYESTPPHLYAFVAAPSKNEKHSMGLAIDCGLSDLEGNEIPMPSGFDEFNESAYVGYTGGTAEEQANRDYLIQLMERCGFTVYAKEWWHFSFPNPAGLEAQDISFGEFVALRDAE